jgi:iron-sulfur cluster repair protein YtfE (RIC family)
MQSQRTSFLIQQEGRIILALKAYTLGQFKSVQSAAAAFKVPFQQLSNQLHKIRFQQEAPPNSQKLSATEEQTIVQYILNLNSRGFAPQLCKVADIADKVLAVRSRTPVSKN